MLFFADVGSEVSLNSARKTGSLFYYFVVVVVRVAAAAAAIVVFIKQFELTKCYLLFIMIVVLCMI